MNKDKNKKQVGSMDYRKALNEAKFEGNKQGRPSKINQINLNLLCDYLEKGLPIQDACMKVGIHPKYSSLINAFIISESSSFRCGLQGFRESCLLLSRVT